MNQEVRWIATLIPPACNDTIFNNNLLKITSIKALFIVTTSERSECGCPPQRIDLYDFLDSPTYAEASARLAAQSFSIGGAGTSALWIPQNDDY
jgi:hypothetical protein